MAGLSLLMITRCPTGNFRKKCLLLTSPGNYMAYLGPCTEVTGAARARGVWGPESGRKREICGLLLLFGSSMGPKFKT